MHPFKWQPDSKLPETYDPADNTPFGVYIPNRYSGGKFKMYRDIRYCKSAINQPNYTVNSGGYQREVTGGIIFAYTDQGWKELCRVEPGIRYADSKRYLDQFDNSSRP